MAQSSICTPFRCAILGFGLIAQKAAEHVLGSGKMKRPLFQIILFAGAVPFAGGQPLPDLQQRIQIHMGEYLAHLPNYTCRVTIARSSRPGPDRNFELTDRIRLEVEFAGGKELYSWPGEDRFEHGLEKLVGGIPGLISIGSYALLTRALFTTDAAEFGSPREVAWVPQSRQVPHL